jgi:hypothetical protein
MIAEAAHSWADTGNQVFLFMAERRSRRPRDESHPMGYGREAYVWSMFAAFGLFTQGRWCPSCMASSRSSGPSPRPTSWWRTGADVLVAQSRLLQRLIHPDAVTAGYAVAELVSEHSFEQFQGLVASVFELEWPVRPAGQRDDLAQVAAPALIGLDRAALLGIAEGAIVLISNDVKHRTLIQRVETALQASPSKVRVRGIGSSMTTEWKDGLREVYLEAAYAARIAGRVPETLHHTEYANLGALVLLRHIPWTKRSVAGISPDASALLSEGNTTNVQTLLAYLRWAGDARRTCAELNIHRTTLYYRLDRCRDHIGDALEHGWRRTSLYLALVLSELSRSQEASEDNPSD